MKKTICLALLALTLGSNAFANTASGSVDVDDSSSGKKITITGPAAQSLYEGLTGIAPTGPEQSKQSENINCYLEGSDFGVGQSASASYICVTTILPDGRASVNGQ